MVLGISESQPEFSSDVFLRVALTRLRQTWLDQRVGIVAAALALPDGEIYTATSIQSEPGKYIHAELAAIRLAEKHGVSTFPAESLMAITISPCTRPSVSRIGPACVTVLEEYGIRHVHVGTLDPTQGDVDQYTKFGLRLTVTRNERLRGRCDQLLGLFARYGNRINTDILSIKREIGLGFWGSTSDERF